MSQIKNSHDLPLHFASRVFEKGELNRDIVEKEMLAIHFEKLDILKQFHDNLIWGGHCGRRKLLAKIKHSKPTACLIITSSYIHIIMIFLCFRTIQFPMENTKISINYIDLKLSSNHLLLKQIP